jgi:hypothetical protein
MLRGRKGLPAARGGRTEECRGAPLDMAQGSQLLRGRRHCGDPFAATHRSLRQRKDVEHMTDKKVWFITGAGHGGH